MKIDTPEEETINEPMTLGGNVIAPLVLDPDEYREDLAEFELTEAQENELLQTLWDIMRTFVEIGYGLDSVQKLFPQIFEKSGKDSGKLVQQNSTQKPFRKAALPCGDRNKDDA